MDFPHGVTVYRDRRLPVPSPYNPDTMRAGTWDDPVDTITLEQAFVASSSSTAVRDATRAQILTAKSLYLTDPTADVLPGDRIRAGGEPLYIHVKPQADVNPFTGWQPVMEIPLEDVEG